MKTFITSLFLFFTISLFAQPQKGDLYVGPSSFRFNRTNNIFNGFSGISQSFITASPTFGKFIADNTLVSGGLLFSTNLANALSPITSTPFLGINLFGAQYFGKGKLKGLSQFSLRADLVESDFRRRQFTGDLGLGGAYFVNEFTSVQLLYSINVFTAVEGFSTDYFSNGIDPNIGLSLRTFLLRNREGIENLTALNSIKKGTSVLGLNSGLLLSPPSNSKAINASFSYFFLDNFYAQAGFVASKNENSLTEFDFANLEAGLELGAYFRLTEKLYARLSTNIRGQRMKRAPFFNFTSEPSEEGLTTNFMRWNSELGLVLFLGRHKLEPGVGYRVSNTVLKELSSEKNIDVSPNLFIRYEWFLAENFAFTANFDARYQDVNYFVGVIDFSNPEMPVLGVSEFIQKNMNLGLGFKWYFSTQTD